MRRLTDEEFRATMGGDVTDLAGEVRRLSDPSFAVLERVLGGYASLPTPQVVN